MVCIARVMGTPAASIVESPSYKLIRESANVRSFHCENCWQDAGVTLLHGFRFRRCQGYGETSRDKPCHPC
jgi:hypothetical protein